VSRPRLEDVPPRGQLLHNMSAPPVSRVVVAPRYQARPRVGFRLVTRLLRGWRGDPETLLARLSLDAEATGGDALAALQLHTDAVLDRLCIPAVVPLVPREGPPLRGHALLHVAFVSRCAGQVFLRRRSPRFDLDALTREWTTVDERVLAIVGRSP
jgi:hypothetical protein